MTKSRLIGKTITNPPPAPVFTRELFLLSTGVAFNINVVLYTYLMARPLKTEGLDEAYWQNKYYTLFAQWKKDVIDNDGREESNKKARWELLLEIKRLEDNYDRLTHELRRVLQHGDKS